MTMTLKQTIAEQLQEIADLTFIGHTMESKFSKLEMDYQVKKNRANDFEGRYNALKSRMDGYREATKDALHTICSTSN
jgi:hypothetical protein